MSNEELHVLSTIEELRQRDEPMALATIVSVSGSTYRREGARLLVPSSGEAVGNISGGCLEDDVERAAREAMATDQGKLLHFDLTADEEAVWGWGLGCNGAIEVLVEPADRAAEVAGALRRAIESEQELVAATVLDSTLAGVERGARLVVRPGGTVEGGLGDWRVDQAVVDEAQRALAEGRSRTARARVGDEEVRVFLEAIDPPPRLLVCGAGHDAIPLVEQAARLGWRVVVVDDRKGFLTSERFPSARGFVHVDRPGEAASAAGVDARTNVVVMSHNYLRDMEYLRSFLDTDAAYIGMLGPGARLQRLLGDLAKQGIQPSAADLEKIHGPAGLDIGAEGPDEIAWSIVAEVLAVTRGRSGGFLRDRRRPIHDRPDGEDTVAPDDARSPRPAPEGVV